MLTQKTDADTASLVDLVPGHMITSLSFETPLFLDDIQRELDRIGSLDGAPGFVGRSSAAIFADDDSLRVVGYRVTISAMTFEKVRELLSSVDVRNVVLHDNNNAFFIPKEEEE